MVGAEGGFEARGESEELARRLGAVGWALFFIWLGIVFLAGIPSWISLLGIGVITLGIQVARKVAGLGVEGFWALLGIMFVLGGVWELIGTTVPLVPILLILAGAAVLLSIVWGRRA